MSLSKRRLVLFSLGAAAVLLVLAALADPAGFAASAKAVLRFFKTIGQTVSYYAKTAEPFQAGLALCLLGFFDSSFTPIPEGNDLLVVYFTLHHPSGMPWFVLASTAGSLLGSFILFAMGRRGGEMIVARRVSADRFQRIKAWFTRRGFWAVFLPCITPPPMPFKLFVLTAGVMRLSWSTFTAATVCGRIVRYGLWGVLTVLYRDEIMNFMEHRMLQVGLAICGALALLILASWMYSRYLKRDTGAAMQPPSEGNPG